MSVGIVSGAFWIVSMTGVVVSTTAGVVSTALRMALVMFEGASSTTASASAAL
jgi:hypothetical protein